MKNFVKLSLPVLFLLSIQTTVNAQPDSLWSRTFGQAGYDHGREIVKLSNGGYALGITSRGPREAVTGLNLELMRLDDSFDSLWTIDPYVADWQGSGIIQTQDDCLILYGTIGDGFIFSATHIFKYDIHGNRVWERGLNGQGYYCQCNQVVEDQHENMYVFCQSPYDTLGNITLFQLNADGALLSTKHYNLPDDLRVSDAICTEGGELLLTGSFETDDELRKRDMFVMMLNGELEIEWFQRYGDPNSSEDGKNIVQTHDNEFALLVSRYLPNVYKPDFLLLKYGIWGNFIDSKSFNTEEEECGSGFLLADNGDFIIYGQKRSWRGGSDGWIEALNSEGEFLWETTLGGGSDDLFSSASWDSNGNLLLVGSTSSFGAGESDIWLVSAELSLGVPTSSPYINPSSLSLSAFPSPFNSSTFVSFQTPFTGEVKATLTDFAGRIIKGWIPASTGMENQVRFAVDGAGLAAGTYWLKVAQNGQSAATRLVLVK